MLTKTDLAKYPFTKEAADYVKQLGIRVEDLNSEEYTPVLDRAEKRLEEAIIESKVSKEWQNNEVEILSFPTAVMLANYLDERVRRRYALAESKRAYELLRNELQEKMLNIAVNTFEWKIKLVNSSIGESYYDYALHFKNYLRNAVNIRESGWKIVNRLLIDGYVYLTKSEVARLLQEEVQRKISEKTMKEVAEMPPSLKSRMERLQRLMTVRKFAAEEMPKIVVEAAMPPCIRSLYDSLLAGKNISHTGRFALTSFLINIGASEDDVIKVFKITTDFDEKKTKYQVEHIAGKRGAKTKYIPPKCDTLKTHGLCAAPNELCKQIRHPLIYYRRKLKTMFKREK
jgi:DNA primase large subunit